MGGPPLVSPNRVKVGVSVRNDDEDERDTWLVVMKPRPGGNIIGVKKVPMVSFTCRHVI